MNKKCQTPDSNCTKYKQKGLCEYHYERQPHVIAKRKAWRKKNRKYLVQVMQKWVDENRTRFNLYQKQYQRIKARQSSSNKVKINND